MLLIDHLDFDTKVQAQNMLIHTLAKASEPGSPAEGQVYTDITNHILNFHNGTAFRNLAMGPTAGVTDSHVVVWDGTTGAYLKSSGVLVHAAVSVSDSNSVNLTLSTQDITADVNVQMSIEIPDASGLSLVNDSASPGNDKLYGTSGAGVKGWFDQPAGLGSHNILDGSTHGDSAATTVLRGMLITGQTATPVWDGLVVGTNQVLHSDGTDTQWATMLTMATTGGMQTDTTATNTLVFSGYDVGAVGYQDMIVITAHATQPTMVISTGLIQANDGTSSITITNATGAITTSHDLTVTGDLTVNGTTTTIDTETLRVEDPLISMGRLNTTTDAVDLGIYWTYGATPNYGGIFRDVSDGNRTIVFYEAGTVEPTTTVTWATYADVGFGIVRAGTWEGTTIAVDQGGTGQTAWTQWGVLYAPTTGSLGNTAGPGTTGMFLRGVASGAPAWSTLVLPNAATAGQIMRASGSNTIAMTTATYPATATVTGSFLRVSSSNVIGASTLTIPNTVAINNLLYASTANNMVALATVNSAILITTAGGVPTWDTLTGANHITRIVSIAIGDGDGEYTWNHGLALATDTDIIVQCWGVNVSTDIQVFPTITVVDANNIKFNFGFNVTAGDYKAVLIY